MNLQPSSVQVSDEQLAEQFFRESAGQWRSERRYYTLKSGDIQEVVSLITVEYLTPDSPEMIELARLHGLPDASSIICGARSTWDSHYAGPGKKQSSGTTVFGVSGSILYRDRGFSTPNPVTASFYMRGSKTMCLRTEYGGSSFEEELKLIGTGYRTRQTIISRAGQEIMIGQYLEKRLT